MTGTHSKDTAGSEGPSDQEQTPSAEELHEQIAATRADLGDAVDALSGKLDVGSRVKTRVDTAKRRTGEQVRKARASASGALVDDQGGLRSEYLAAGIAVAAVVVVLVVRHQRR